MALEQARELSRLAKELIAGASAVVEQSEELVRSLDQRAGTAAGNGATARADDANGHAKEINWGDEPAREGSPISDRARLLAAQMSVAGTPRDEIAERLHEELGIRDAGPMLDRMGI